MSESYPSPHNISPELEINAIERINSLFDAVQPLADSCDYESSITESISSTQDIRYSTDDYGEEIVIESTPTEDSSTTRVRKTYDWGEYTYKLEKDLPDQRCLVITVGSSGNIIEAEQGHRLDLNHNIEDAEALNLSSAEESTKRILSEVESAVTAWSQTKEVEPAVTDFFSS